MQQLAINDLPPCLKKSRYCKEFSESDSVLVPKKHKIQNIKVTRIFTFEIKNNQDLIQTLDNLRYWMVDDLPYEIYDYVVDNYQSIHDEKILDK